MTALSPAISRTGAGISSSGRKHVMAAGRQPAASSFFPLSSQKQRPPSLPPSIVVHKGFSHTTDDLSCKAQGFRHFRRAEVLRKSTSR
jgi:hypothetical protein